MIVPPLGDLAGLDLHPTPHGPAWLAPLFEVVPVQLAALRLAQLREMTAG